MKQKIVQWFLNWALKHFPQYWEISYTRMGKYACGQYLDLNDARNRANQIIKNFQEAETLEKSYRMAAPEVHIKHFLNIQGVCLIELPKDQHVFYALKRPDAN